jgi:hypothetical protein
VAKPFVDSPRAAKSFALAVPPGELPVKADVNQEQVQVLGR